MTAPVYKMSSLTLWSPITGVLQELYHGTVVCWIVKAADLTGMFDGDARTVQTTKYCKMRDFDRQVAYFESFAIKLLLLNAKFDMQYAL